MTTRSRLLSCGLWLCLVIALLVGSGQSRFAPSFHDLGGGRLPMSDGAAWFIGSTQASQGSRLAWIARRPLNVAFNAPLIRLSHRLAADPLAMTLQLKRALAVAAIAALLIALEGCCSLLARLGVGLSLLSSLFVSRASDLSYLIGSGVGYTQGSELNAFIVVVAAAACLVAAARHPGLAGQRRRLLFLAPALFLLGSGCLMRPGTLLLLPLLIALFAVVELRSLAQPCWPLKLPVARRLSPLLLSVGLGLGGCLLLQQLTFAQVNDSCGAIGGNQGLTLYGLSQGRDWYAGLAYQQTHAPDCEKESNRLLKREALRAFVRDPRPALGVVLDNIDKNNHVAFTARARPGRRSWPLFPVAAATLIALLLRRRLPGEGGLLRPDNLVLLIALAGWLSMECFMLILFRDAYLRPLTPYAVFPILALACLADRALAAPTGVRPSVRLPSLWLLLLPGCLLLQLLWGNLILLRAAPLPPTRFPDQVSGAFPITISELRNTGGDLWMFALGLPSNYRLLKPLPAALQGQAHKQDGTYCLTYQRRRLLDSFASFGAVAIEAAPCRP